MTAILLGCSGPIDDLPVDDSEQSAPPVATQQALQGDINAVGATKGEFAVRHDGNATLSIPLTVPRGPGGAGPALELRYSSGATTGLAGAGWSLSGYSAVTRCQKTIAADGTVGRVAFNADDRFCLDGRRLIEVGSGAETDGSPYWEYRTEIESFSRVRAYSDVTSPTLSLKHNPAYWEVRSRSGMRMVFGGRPDARSEMMAGAPSVLLWALSKTVDPAGNVVTYAYQGSPQIYLASVTYGGNERNGALGGHESVALTYEARPAGDVRRMSIAGFSTVDGFRLSQVDTSVGGQRVRRYRLTYSTSLSGRGLLSSLQECGFEGGVTPVCLAATTMTYEPEVAQLRASARWGTGFGSNARVGDFDGNGTSDVFELKAGTSGSGEAIVSLSRLR